MKFKNSKLSKNEEKKFAPKEISKENLERIFMEGQSSKESTSARYLFLCLKLASIEVSRLRDTITQT